jgi:uncharacterized membrane protein YsdA (DUF1294 family)
MNIRTSQMLALILVILFFAILSVLAFITKMIPPFIIILYGGASVVSFVAYAIDKVAAQKGNWRTPEATLHLMSLVGGWPRALIAQQFLRHKSSKVKFKAVYKITILLNLAVTAGLFALFGSTS